MVERKRFSGAAPSKAGAQPVETMISEEASERPTAPPGAQRQFYARAVLAAAALALLVYLAWNWWPGKNKGREGPPPQSVGVATIAKGDLRVFAIGLGTVTPLATVNVVTQISGQLTQVAFHEGQIVKKGDFLAQIDPRPYEIMLAQYRGAAHP